MKRVLIVSYRFPPQPYIGSLRAGKFAKYLPEFGWEPIILTVDLERNDGLLPEELTTGSVIRTRDFDFTNELKKLFKINPAKSIFNMEERTSITRPTKIQSIKTTAIKYLLWMINQFLCFPDPKIGWYYIVKKKYTEVLKDHEIDILFTSSLPNTVHLIGRYLKENLDVPWVADFRDLWTQSHISRRIYPLWKIEQKIEKGVLSSCDAMTTVSKPLAEQLRTFHGKPVTVITNGFDEDDYNYESMKKKNEDGKLRIVYTGKIYPYKRDPSFLFSAVKNLLSEGFLRKGELKIDFYGRDLSWAKQISYKMDMEESVSFHGMVSYRESIQKQMEADILLLLEWTDEQAKGVYTGKIFEYLWAKKPIIAIGPKGGVVDELLRETGSGSLVTSVDETKKILKTWIAAFRQRGVFPYEGNDELILSKYSRRSKAKELAQIFDLVRK